MKRFDIKIRDLTWNVVFADPNEVKFGKGTDPGDEDDCGITFKQDCVIYINNSIKGDLLHRTIVHELTHALIWTYGMEDVKWEEEVICGFIETHLEELVEIVLEIEKNIKEDKKKDGKRL